MTYLAIVARKMKNMIKNFARKSPIKIVFASIDCLGCMVHVPTGFLIVIRKPIFKKKGKSIEHNY